MKKVLLSLCAALALQPAFAQITITASDMPASGDTLRYSFANSIGTTFSIGDSGTSKTWDYSMFTPIAQGVDTFKTASAVNITYAATISASAYGYKVADSIPGLSTVSPVAIKNVYTFFNKKTSPSRYIAEGFAAVIGVLPTPATYSDEDEWYFFPLSYLSDTTTTFSLTFSIPSLVSVKQAGTRRTRVDGWGTIKTPYTASPVSCIRVRSVINEVDSITFGTTALGLPRNTVEYKFLATAEHYPLMWVTTNVTAGTETISTIRYRDTKRTITNIASVRPAFTLLKAYPNPNIDGKLQIDIPNNWSNYSIELYDLQSRKILSSFNNNSLDISHLASGNYIVRVMSGEETGIAQIEKK